MAVDTLLPKSEDANVGKGATTMAATSDAVRLQTLMLISIKFSVR